MPVTYKVLENTSDNPMQLRYEGPSRDEALSVFATCEHGFFQGQIIDGRFRTETESQFK